MRAAAAARLSPAGQLQVATALDMLTALETRLEELRYRLLEAARRLICTGSAPPILPGCWPGSVR